jgi:hypothetical protein
VRFVERFEDKGPCHAAERPGAPPMMSARPGSTALTMNPSSGLGRPREQVVHLDVLLQMGCRRSGWYSYDGLDNGGVARIKSSLDRSEHDDKDVCDRERSEESLLREALRACCWRASVETARSSSLEGIADASQRIAKEVQWRANPAARRREIDSSC